MKQIEGHPNLIKKDNGAIVNVDLDAYNRAKQKKKEKERVASLESRLDRIEALLERLLNVN